ncbi:MAG TPA: phage terminase large subunit [Candidatus Sulfotelmatobacter sp.]
MYGSSTSGRALNLDIGLQPRQIELWQLWDESEYTRIGFGGARGGTKSGGARRCMLLRRLKYARTNGLILRRSLKELEQSHILQLFEEFPALRPFYRDQKKMLSLPNGSHLIFGSAPSAKDMADFYSAEYADIVVDEAQEFSQAELESLSGSNRCTSNRKIVPKMTMGFMPGVSESGIPPRGLSYLKRVFVDHDLRGEEKNEKWAFLQAFGWDNIEWARAELDRDRVSDDEFYSWPDERRMEYFVTRTHYGRKLAALSSKSLREAWLFGKWDTFEGQYFQNWNYKKHSAPAAEIHPKLQTWFEYWLSGDWGDDHPACYQLHCRDNRGHIFTLLELWGREIGEENTARELAKMCRFDNLGLPAGPIPIQCFPFSWDAFGKLNKKTRRAITAMIGESLPENIPHPTPAESSPGSRISGWRLMDQLIDGNKWTISREGCPRLIECLPTLVRDMERNSEDVLKVDYSENYIGDDAADSARYGLQYMVQAPAKPLDLRIEEALAAVEEKLGRKITNTHRQMLMPKIIKEQQEADSLQPWAMKSPRRGGRPS